MLKVIENEQAIRKHQRQLVRAVRSLSEERIPVTIGHLGASQKAKVAWSERLGVWFFSCKVAGSRYWNAFGIGRPEGGAAVAITCEINFPLCGIDRRTGGAFAQDRAGHVFVVHRGKLGGGRKGIGKSLFEDRYRGVWEMMDDGDEQTPVAVIGALHSPRLARQIAQFVVKIARIKEQASAPSPQTELSFDEFGMREELIGSRQVEPEREIGAECDHGLIVRDLAEALKKQGLRTGNDDQRDLLVMERDGRIRAIFQIMTGMSPCRLHAGAMALLLSGVDLPEKPRLFLVLPAAPEGELGEKLRRLDIEMLTYAWGEEGAVFTGLDAPAPGILPGDPARCA
ncbi:MAG: hypothetical protein AB1558_09315 [Thermodesulfobacteriota bacterium]